MAAFSTLVPVSFKEALKRKTVSMTAASTGGLNIGINLKNNSCEDLAVSLDDALIFTPADEAYQNMVVLGGETIVLKPYGNSCIRLKAYCGKSYGICPAKDMKYAFWKQGDEVMRSVVSHIKTVLPSESVIQHAVWTLTNDHSLSSIYDPSAPAKSVALVSLMARLLHKPVPDFYTKVDIINTQDNRMVLGPLQKAVVHMDWSVVSSRNMHVTVYDKDHKVFREVKEENISPSGHKVKVELDPREVPAGTYYVRLWDDENRVWQQKVVEIPEIS
jgi:hypothetical protein